MRILDKTFLSEDEGYDLAGAIGEEVEKALWNLRPKLDSYNEQYVVRVTVDKVDPDEPEPVEDDG